MFNYYLYKAVMLGQKVKYKLLQYICNVILLFVVHLVMLHLSLHVTFKVNKVLYKA